jgi:dihydroxy-acid dehydratase
MKCGIWFSRDIIAASIEMMIESSRVDGIVALSSCDKIVPAQLMALARINLPALMITGGYMLPGRFKGKSIHIGAVSENYPAWKEGHLSNEEFNEIVDCCCPTAGACCMMGTANTFCCLTEALGMSLPGNATQAAVESSLYRLGKTAGRKVMELVEKNIRPRNIMTKESMENALFIHSAIGGSTNAILHMPAIFSELGIDLPLPYWNQVSKRAPHLANITVGSRYNMKDFAQAGGIQATLKELSSILNLNAITCTGRTLGENLKTVVNLDSDVIRPLSNPVYREGSIAVLMGNISPNGAVVKQTAVPKEMLKHRGSARVFDGEDLAKEALLKHRIKPGDVVLIRYEGARGGPGMKCIPSKFSMRIGKIVRCCADGRFSGCRPASGMFRLRLQLGAIAAIKGDIIEYDIPNRKLNVNLSRQEIQKRLKNWKPPEAKIKTGFLGKVYTSIVESPDKGCILKIH